MGLALTQTKQNGLPREMSLTRMPPRLRAMNTNHQESPNTPRRGSDRYQGLRLKSQLRMAGALLAFYIAMSLSVGAILHILGSAEMATAVAAQTIMPCPAGSTVQQASHEE